MTTSGFSAFLLAAQGDGGWTTTAAMFVISDGDAIAFGWDKLGESGHADATHVLKVRMARSGCNR